MIALLVCCTLSPPVTFDPWADVPEADGFDFPVGPPDARDWRLGRGWQVKGHLGVDYNHGGPCDDDLGEPVYAAATGRVHFARDVEGGWGNVVQIAHRLPSGELVQTQYGHLDRIDVTEGELVERGGAVGTVGNAHGIYCSHLHFEVRTDPAHEVGGGYGKPREVFVDPIGFIRSHRPT